MEYHLAIEKQRAFFPDGSNPPDRLQAAAAEAF